MVQTWITSLVGGPTHQVARSHVNLNIINNGDFWGVSPRDSSDNNEEDSSFEENLGDDKFVQNMYSEVRIDEHPFELQDIN